MRNHFVAQSLTGLVLLGMPLFGQGNSNNAPGRLPLPEDWSSQHVVFSPPRSPQAAAALQKNPRYLHQLLRRNSTHGGPKSKPTPLPTGDWNMSMGRAGSSIAPAMFPAKYTFNINATPSCSDDFAVFAEKDPAFARASSSIVLGPGVANNDTITFTGSTTRTYTFVSGTPTAAGQVHIIPGSGGSADQDATATNVVAAINGTGTPGTDYGSGTLVNADVAATGRPVGGSTSGIIYLTARAPGSGGNSITISKPASVAKNHIDLGPDISGDPLLVSLAGGGSAGAGQSTIFAINNLYAGGSDILASGTGSFSGVPAASQTATISNGANFITLTANVATRATGTGTFSANVRGSGSAIITNGANVLTLTPNATSRTIPGTFSRTITAVAAPRTATLTVAGNALVLTDGSATGSGTFTANARSGSATIMNGGNTLTLASNATSTQIPGTFSTTITAAAVRTASFTVGGNTLTLTDGAATGSGTFTANVRATGAATIVNGGNTLTLTPNPTSAQIPGTFSSAITAAAVRTASFTVAGNTLTLTDGSATGSGTFTGNVRTGSATITSGGNTLTLTPNATATQIPGTFSTAIAAAAVRTASFTVAGNTLTLTDGSSTGSGTFTGNVRNTGSATITNGGNTLTLTPNPTSAQILGTFSSTLTAAAVRTASFTVAGNTLTLTDGAATGSGTFTGNVRNTGSATITNGGNILTLTPNPTPKTVTGTFGGNPSTASSGSVTITVGSNALVLTSVASGSDGCTTATAGTFLANIPSASTTRATHLRDAINSCNSSFATVGATATVDGSGGVIVTATTPGSDITFTAVENGGGVNNFSWGGVTGGSDGSNTCSSSTTGTFAISNTSSTEASNLAAAIQACVTGGFLATGVNATASGSTVNVYALNGGSAGNLIALAQTFTSGFTWPAGALSGGSDTNGCTSAISGNFVNSTVVATAATNLAAAINACIGPFPAVGATATSSLGVTTVKATTPGLDITITGAETLGNFSWGTATAGTNGTNGCTSSTAGTFAINNLTTTEAANLVAAIQTCVTGGFLATGVNATASGSTVNVYALNGGSAGDSIALGQTFTSGFTWSAGTLSGGSDTNGCSSATSGNFVNSTAIATAAGNLVLAINACNTSFPAVGATATSIAGVTTVKATTPGADITTITGAETLGNFSWGTGTAGTNGTNGCTSSTTGTFAINNTTTTEATNLVAAIQACVTGGFLATGINATASGSTVNVYALNGGVAGDGIALAQTFTSGFTWSAGTLSGGSDTNGCTSSTSGNFVNNTTVATAAGNLAAAINACNTSFAAVGATATASLGVTTVKATPGLDITITGAAEGLGNFSWGAPTAGTNGTNGCTSATTGTFAINNTTTTEATNLVAAIQACVTGGFLATGINATASGSTVNVYALDGGSAGNLIALAQNFTSGFTWSAGTLSGGSDTNGCTSATSGNFVNNTVVATAAGNLAAAINACNTSFPAVGATATSVAGVTTVKSATPGSDITTITGAETLGNFSWGTAAAGTNGSNGCTSSTTGTFAISNTTTTEATNLVAAIQACVTGGFLATGINATASGSTVNVYALNGGSAGNSIALAQTFASGFTWSAGTLSGGSDTNGCTSAISGNFVNNTDVATAAANLATAISACNTSFSAVGATATSSAGVTTVTAASPGTDITISGADSLGNFSWGGATAGSNGSNTCLSSTSGTFAISNTTTTEATNLAAAINLCPIAAGVTASAGGSTVTISARTLGAAGNSITLSDTLTGFDWGAGALSGGANNDTGTNFSVVSGDTTYNATNLAAAIARSGGTVGATATSAGAVVTVKALSFGPAGNLIVLLEGMNNFTWASSTLQGGDSGGGCGGNPTVTWAYDTSSGTPSGAITTSPVLSLDGKKVAFVEGAFGGPVLHVLRWAPGPGQGSIAVPIAPNTITSGASGCSDNLSLSCLVNFKYGSANGNTFSSPFYNYAPGADTLYVGDDDGVLWKITGVFNGTPTAAWSVTVNSGHRLTSPVFDPPTGNVVVADDSGRVSVVTDAGVLSLTNTITGLTNITDGPILDGSTGKIIVFSGSNGSNAVVVQADTALSPASVVTIPVGHASSTQLHSGTFDNTYYTVGPPSGHLYVCGKGASNDQPALYRISVDGSGKLSSTTDAGPLALTTTANVAAECSPLTEIFNPSQGGGVDWLFAGVPGSCALGGSTTGCVMSFNITSAFPTSASFAGAEAGGTSGIIVDNVSTDGQASSLYYSTLIDDAKCGTGGCAVKRTQAGLQ